MALGGIAALLIGAALLFAEARASFVPVLGMVWPALPPWRLPITSGSS
jgi:hypothetical protein